jgi:hypothetical protein
MWIGFICFRYRLVVGSCENDNEPIGSTKYGKFDDQLSALTASQERLCSMEIAVFSIRRN